MSVTILLGFDYGTKRIGVAVGQTITRTATAIKQIDVDSNNAYWQEIEDLIVEYKPELMIVGKPLNMDQTPSRMSRKAEAFAKTLADRYDIPVQMIDERLSSRAAEDSIIHKTGKKKINKPQLNSVAAQIILQDYLDTL